jgi:hypothetical protein
LNDDIATKNLSLMAARALGKGAREYHPIKFSTTQTIQLHQQTKAIATATVNLAAFGCKGRLFRDA